MSEEVRLDLGDINRIIKEDDLEALLKIWSRLVSFHRLVLFRKAASENSQRILRFTIEDFEGDEVSPDWYCKALRAVHVVSFSVRERLVKKLIEKHGIEWCLTSDLEILREHAREIQCRHL